MNLLKSNSHLEEDALELYALQRISEDELPAFEEHLLICHECQDRLAETDEYIAAMRAATAKLEHHAPTIWERMAEWVRSIPQPALALGFAAAMALFLMVRVPQSGVQVVELTAMRGPETGVHVGSGVRPELRLGAEGLAAATYRVEVVNAEGSKMWQGMVPVKNRQLTVALPSRLATGKYWIRVHADASGEDALREYGLTVDK